MDIDKSLETVDKSALCSAAPWLQSCPDIVLGGMNAQLLGGLTSGPDCMYVRCKCPSCAGQPNSAGIRTLVEHVEHVTDEAMPTNLCLTVLFVEVGTSQISLKSYMKLVGEQYKGSDLVGTKLWLYRFDLATLNSNNSAAAAGGPGLWVEAQVTGYNDKLGEHELTFAEGSPLSGQHVKVFIGATHIHFGSSPPAAGQTPNRMPPGGLTSDSLPGFSKQQQQQAAIMSAAQPSSAAAAPPNGTRSPKKRQAALAAAAHWAAAGLPVSSAIPAAAKRHAAASGGSGAGGGGGVKKARVSGGGSEAAAAGALSQQQRQSMMFGFHHHSYHSVGQHSDRRSGRPPSASLMMAEPQSKTSRFRGVSWNKRTLKWQVTLYARGRYRYFGSYTNQEEAACAYDRAALVWKGPSAQLNYPASTYLKGNQKQALQLLQEQAQQEAAKGNEPPPELPAGEAGTAALAAVAAKEEAAAGGTASGTLGRAFSPTAATAAAATTNVRLNGRRRGSSSVSDQVELVAPVWEAGSAGAPVGRVAQVVKQDPDNDLDEDEGDEDSPSDADDLGDDGLEEGEMSEGGDLSAGPGNNMTGADMDTAAWAGSAGFRKKRKRKAQGKLFTRKKIHKQELALLNPAALSAYGASGAMQPSQGKNTHLAAAATLGMIGSDGDVMMPPLSKEQQTVAAATAAAAAAAAGGRPVGAAKRKPGRPPKDHVRQAQAAAAEPQLVAAAAVAAAAAAAGLTRNSRLSSLTMKVESLDDVFNRQGDPGSSKRLPRRRNQQQQQPSASEAAAAEDAAGTAHEPDTQATAAASSTPPAAGAVGVNATTSNHPVDMTSGSDGAACGDGDDAETRPTADAGGDAEEDEGGIATRRSQRQAARKAQRKTARRMASVVNARSDGLWARLMRRAGSDAESSDNDGSGTLEGLGFERGDIEAIAAAAQLAGVPHDAVVNAQETALKLFESGAVGGGGVRGGRGRGRGRGRKGQGRRGRPPGSGIAARMAELHAQFVALGGVYNTTTGGDSRGPASAVSGQEDLAAGPADVDGRVGMDDDVFDDVANDDDGIMDDDESVLPDVDQGSGDDDNRDEQDDGVEFGEDDADVAALLLGLTGALGGSRGQAAEQPGSKDHDDDTAAAGGGGGFDDEADHAERDSADAAAAVSHRTAGGRLMPARDRGHNSKYDDMEDWQPRSGRGRGRGRGRSRGRAAAAAAAGLVTTAPAAASYSGVPSHPVQQPEGTDVVGGKGGRVRPRAAAAGGYGRPGYHPAAVALSGYNYWQHQQQHAAAALASKPWGMGGLHPGASAGLAVQMLRSGGVEQQQQPAAGEVDGDDVADGEQGEQQQQQQPAVLDQAAAESLLSSCSPQQVAQHFVQVMFMAFTTGAPQYLQEFQTLYSALCNSPTHMNKVMHMLFQFGTQMGATIAASGGAPTVAAAFSNMAAMAGLGNMHDMPHMAAAAGAADILAQQMQANAAAAATAAAGVTLTSPLATSFAAVVPNKKPPATGKNADTAAAKHVATSTATVASASKAPSAVAAADRGAVPGLRSPWPLVHPPVSTHGFTATAGSAGVIPAMAAAAHVPSDYMRLMMGLPVGDSDEELESEPEDEVVNRMAAGAVERQQSGAYRDDTAAAVGLAAAGTPVKASSPPQSSAAIATTDSDQQQPCVIAPAGPAEAVREPIPAAAVQSNRQADSTCAQPAALAQTAIAAVDSSAAGPGAGRNVQGPYESTAAAVVQSVDNAAMPPEVLTAATHTGLAADSKVHHAAAASSAQLDTAVCDIAPAVAGTGVVMDGSAPMAVPSPQMAAAVGYQQPAGFVVLPTAAGFVAMPRAAYSHMQLHQQLMMHQQPQQYMLAHLMTQQQQPQHLPAPQVPQKRGLNLQQPSQLAHQPVPQMHQQPVNQLHSPQSGAKGPAPPVVLNLAAVPSVPQQHQLNGVGSSATALGPPRQLQMPATVTSAGTVLALNLGGPSTADSTSIADPGSHWIPALAAPAAPAQEAPSISSTAEVPVTLTSAQPATTVEASCSLAMQQAVHNSTVTPHVEQLPTANAISAHLSDDVRAVPQQLLTQ